MTRTVSVLTLVCGMIATAPLLACGDKFLLPVRGSRFQQAPPDRIPATILLYANPATRLPASLKRLSIDGALRKVGYHPTTVASAEAFERAINESTWDVVMIDIRDRGSLPAHLRGRAGTVVLPIAENAARDEIMAAQTQYPRVLKSPSRTQAFVDAVDDALSSRQRAPKGR